MSTELFRTPTDTISCIEYSKKQGDEDILLVSSWDNTLRLYDTKNNAMLSMKNTENSLLCCSFLGSSSKAIYAGLAKNVNIYDFETETKTLLGIHSQGVSSCCYDSDINTACTGSWDKTVCIWDLRMENLRHKLSFEGKVYGVATTSGSNYYSKLIVIDSKKSIYIYDMRAINQPEEVRDNLLTYLPRCVQAFNNGLGFAVGTVEGRVYYQYFDPDINKTKNVNVIQPEELKTLSSYSFKCHRQKVTQENNPNIIDLIKTQGSVSEIIYPVNSIAFNPIQDYFATAGCDGTIAIWNGLKKKRLWRLTKAFNLPVTSLCFNKTGTKLAIGVSHDDTKYADQNLRYYSQIIIKDMSQFDFSSTIN